MLPPSLQPDAPMRSKSRRPDFHHRCRKLEAVPPDLLCTARLALIVVVSVMTALEPALDAPYRHYWLPHLTGPSRPHEEMGWIL